jgi:parallel beta-helix repeat protein
MGAVTNTISHNYNFSAGNTNQAGAQGGIVKTITVRNSAELRAALVHAGPGTKIQLALGVYSGHFELNGKTGVTIEGPKNAILNGGNNGYTLHLNNCRNITLTGFTVSGGQKGIVLDGSNKSLLNNLTVKDTGMEGIHFRRNSSYNVLQNSNIDNTGLQNPGFGEGVYIGSDPKNFKNDHSNFNRVMSNTFGPHVRAENIDVKTNTQGGVIANNHFNILGITGANHADSAVDVKFGATGYQIYGNSTVGVGSHYGRGNITFENGAQPRNSVHDNKIIGSFSTQAPPIKW